MGRRFRARRDRRRFAAWIAPARPALEALAALFDDPEADDARMAVLAQQAVGALREGFHRLTGDPAYEGLLLLATLERLDRLLANKTGPDASLLQSCQACVRAVTG